MRVFLILCWILACLIAGLMLGSRLWAKRHSERIKPWITYNRLMHVAHVSSAYHTQWNRWPGSIEELSVFQPDMQDPWTKDAWGRDLVLSPYDQSASHGNVISFGRDGRPGGSDLDRDLEVRFPITGNEGWNVKMSTGLEKPQRRP